MTDFSEDIEKSLEVLRQGGTILYPTDTIWGIGCDATNEAAVEKIYSLKHRSKESSMIVLLADERDILQYVAGIDLLVFDYLATVKKPTTVIYEGAIGLAQNAINMDGSIGIRLIEEPFCKTLIKRLRKPLISTSANISGEPSPQHFGEVSDAIKNGVDYAVQYRQRERAAANPSAIIKWKGNGKIEIIRE